MVCYDLDTFRSFVSSTSFTEPHDMPAEEAGQILADNTALMLFGFRFLKQVLFGKNSIALKQEAAKKRRERVQGKTQAIEREAKEKRMAEQDDMYGNSQD
jgi:uncharacterized protein